MDVPLIREASADDVDAIVALVESAYRGESSRAGWTTEADLLDGRRTDAEDVAKTLAEPDSVILLAVGTEDEILGCCNVKRRGEDAAYFGLFAVSPILQGGGIGGRLLEAAEDRARTEWSAERLEMSVLGQRADLIAWYTRRGYQPTGRDFPWPHSSKTFGIPRRDDLYFTVLAKPLGDQPADSSAR